MYNSIHDPPSASQRNRVASVAMTRLLQANCSYINTSEVVTAAKGDAQAHRDKLSRGKRAKNECPPLADS